MLDRVAKIPQYRKSWAIIIGIDDYEHVSRLKNAVNDAKELANLLRNIGFEVIELYNHDATKDSILSLFIDDGQLPDKIGANDRVLVFFSGHGTTSINKRDQSKSGYIVPCDGYSGKWNSLIEFNDLVHKCVKMLVAKHILFLMDCCFSGIAALRLMPTDNTPIPAMPTDDFVLSCTSKNAIQIIVAGQADQLVLDASIFIGHSPFTGAIIHGLKTWEADLHEDGVITATELGVYLDRKVSDVANIYGHKQKPFANRLVGDEGGDFVLLVSETPKHETLEQFRTRIKNLTLAEHVRMIKEETGCLITSLIEGKDIVAVSYPAFAKNVHGFQTDLVAVMKTIGRMYDPLVSYKITVNYPDFSIKKEGEDAPEVLTLEISAPILQRYVNKEITLAQLWSNARFFKKEPVTYAVRVKEGKMDLVI